VATKEDKEHNADEPQANSHHEGHEEHEEEPSIWSFSKLRVLRALRGEKVFSEMSEFGMLHHKENRFRGWRLLRSLNRCWNKMLDQAIYKFLSMCALYYDQLIAHGPPPREGTRPTTARCRLVSLTRQANSILSLPIIATAEFRFIDGWHRLDGRRLNYSWRFLARVQGRGALPAEAPTGGEEYSQCRI